MIHREDFWKIIRAIESKGRITTWPVYIIAEHTAAALYGLAPRHQPRKMEYIMSKFVSRMETHEQVKSHGATGTEKFYYFETDFDGIRTIIHDLLKQKLIRMIQIVVGLSLRLDMMYTQRIIGRTISLTWMPQSKILCVDCVILVLLRLALTLLKI